MPQVDSHQLFEQVEKSLNAQNFPPLYFFYGEEPYLVQQAVQYLKICSLHGMAADFNFSSYYASDVDLQTVIDEVETLPMMTSRRVVILREAQELSDKEWERLEPLLETPVASTVFIIVAQRIDKRKKYFKQLLEQAIVSEFKKPYENQIPGWIRHICKAFELEIQEAAIPLLHRMVGSQLVEIESEVKKLADYLDDRKEITVEDVATVVSRRREENVFVLAEKIASGDRVSALLQLAQLLDQGQSEVGIVSLVARHMRILLLIKQGLEEGLSGQKLAAYALVPNYYVQDYLNQAKKWKSLKLESVLVVLAEVDKAIKTSPLSSHIWLENLIFKTCQLNQQAQHPG